MSEKILGLFFTKGISVEIWKKTGLLDREKLIYEKLLNEKVFDKIYWFTYGSNDKKYKEELHKGIEIISMPIIFNVPLGKLIYSFLLPFLQRKHLKKCQIYKTNQIWGSWTAVISKWLYQKFLYVRTGYTLSIFAKLQNKKFTHLKSKLAEQFAYKYADFSAVSSKLDSKYILENYKLENSIIVPNFIDTNLFKPNFLQKKKDIVFVGRLNEQKNLFNLIKAVAKTNYLLDIYGDGNLLSELIQLTKELKIEGQIQFKGKVANKELPAIINKYKIYTLPSFYEGMPKTLLEAMSCGVACIGTNVNGISEVLKHNINGIITKTDSESIRCSIENLMQNEDRRVKIGENARIDIKNKFSLEKIFELEKAIYS